MDFRPRSLLAGAAAIVIATGIIVTLLAMGNVQAAAPLFFFALAITFPPALTVFAVAHFSGRTSWRSAALGGAAVAALLPLVTFSPVLIGIFAAIGATGGLLVWMMAGQRLDDPPPSGLRLALLSLGAASVIAAMYAITRFPGEATAY